MNILEMTGKEMGAFHFQGGDWQLSNIREIENHLHDLLENRWLDPILEWRVWAGAGDV